MNLELTWAAVEALQNIVERRDGVALKLNWDTLLARPADSRTELAEFRDGQLVAFLGRYPFGSTLEVCGMVHPDYRRQGIFTSLLKRGLSAETLAAYSTVLLNAPGNSESARQFLAAVPCRFDFTEYQMKYAEDAIPAGSPANGPFVALRQARETDRALLSRLDHEGFNIDADETQRYYEEMSASEIGRNELIVLDGEAVGKIRVSRRDGEAWIYAFVVTAGRRGQGIGGAALRQVIARELAGGYEIWLEVALDNDHAKKLYENAGFRVCRSQNYYAYLR